MRGVQITKKDSPPWGLSVVACHFLASIEAGNDHQ